MDKIFLSIMQLVVVGYNWNSSQNKFNFFASENLANNELWNIKQQKYYD